MSGNSSTGSLRNPAQELLGHPVRDGAEVLLAEMRIPHRHLDGLVAEDLLDLPDRGARHRQVAGAGVAQVMKPEVLHSRILEGLLPGFAREGRRPFRSREEKV